MKNCELCKFPAATYCESDQASLCWDCDAKVHGANFLFARHLRSLLCQNCQSQTPWRASGARLGHTVSVCERCSHGEVAEESEDENGEDDGEDVVSVEDGEEDEEEGENQVVPWSALADASPAPPAATSSSSSEESGGDRDVSGSVDLRFRKRMLEGAPDNLSREIVAEKEAVSGDLKRRCRERTTEEGGAGGGRRGGAVTEPSQESNTIDLNFPKECWRPN